MENDTNVSLSEDDTGQDIDNVSDRGPTKRMTIDTNTSNQEIRVSLHFMIFSCLIGSFFDYYDYSLATYFSYELGKAFFPNSQDRDTTITLIILISKF